MPVVWATTFGAISSVIVTSALAPLPDGLITKPFSIAVIIWHFIILIFSIVAAIGLGIINDVNGWAWSIVCAFSSLSSFTFLAWYGKYVLDAQNNANENTTPKLSTTELVRMSNISVTENASYDASTNNENEETIRDASSTNNNNNINNKNNNEQATNKNSTWTILKPILIQGLLWLVLFVFYLIPIGFGLQSALVASESQQYPKPGTTYNIAISQDSSIEIPMHLYCTGNKTATPLIVMETDFGLSGFSLYNLQNSLSSYSKYNFRVCSYDRAGYGWSNISPLGSNAPYNNAYRLQQLLLNAGEITITGTNTTKMILLGYGEGVEMMQIFEQYNSNSNAVVSFIMIDGYPSLYRLQGLSTTKINANTKDTCGTYQIARSLESAVYMRPYTDYTFNQADKNNVQFTPSSQLDRYKSTFNNNKYWATLFNDLCVRLNSAVQNTNYLSNLAYSLGDSNLYGTGVNQIAWPKMNKNVPVLIVVASSTIYTSNEASLYYNQALRYNETISPTNSTTFVVCENCQHSFAYDHNSNWLVQEIETFLLKFL
jgi:pimeloyl-ACP methyl ester carboxylesterase